MRVLYSFPDEIGRPGIGSTAFHQVREVAARGVDVTLYCTRLRGELPENVRVVQTLSVGGRRVPHRVLRMDRSYRYHDLRVAAALRRIHATIDVVHCWPRATVHTARAARRQGIPCLREVPNTHTAHAFEAVAREVETLGMAAIRGHSHTFSRQTLALEAEEYDVADALLVPSRYFAPDVPRPRGAARKARASPLRLRPEAFLRDCEWHPREADRPFTAIFVGRCEPRKGLHHALRAWLDSDAAEGGRFVICGSFEPGYREVLEPLLAHPSVEVHGYVPDPATLMRDSDVFVLPSVEEGSALVTYEAQACGCVPLVSEAAGARCRDGVDGLVHAPGDVATLTDQLTRVHREPRFLERLRSAGLAPIADLSWPAAGRELVEIYMAQAGSAGKRRQATARSGR